MKNITLFLIILIGILVSCKKVDDNTMPPYSETGENMLAFKANGEVWKFENYISYALQPLHIGFGESQGYGYCNIWAKNKNGSDLKINLLNNITEPGIYIIKRDSTLYSNDNVCFNWEDEEYCYYSLCGIDTGYIQINKLDTIERIVAGKFEIELTGQNNEHMKITEGQFDISY